jgi:spore germination cell wall hydrolase CwlJ-like protein
MLSDRANIRTRFAAAAGLALAALVLIAAYLAQSRDAPAVVALAPEADGSPLPEVRKMEPQLVRPLTPEQAMTANAALPLMADGLERAFSFESGDNPADPLAHRAALECLTAAIYYEAASEDERGQRSVAQVVLNRVRHPAFPSSVCGVVYQGSQRRTGCQFTFTCDGSLTRRPSRPGWQRARRIAEQALAGGVESAVGMATHYHANWVVPYWAPELDKIASVGAHIFYRWRGHWGRRQMFTQAYAGETPVERPRLAYAPDLLGFEGEERPDMLVVPSLQADLPEGSRAATPRTAGDGLRPRLLADETLTGLIADEKNSKLIDEASPRPSP